MKKRIISIWTSLLLAQFSCADEAARDRTKVEFFEKLYKIKIEGVKPFEEYPDPDQFYSAIARQVGIPKKAFDAVEKKFGWKQNDEFFLAAMVKGGGVADDWGVMVTRFPTGLKTAKSIEEKKKLLEAMEMKMVVINYDGTISFPKEKKEEPDAPENERPETGHAPPEKGHVPCADLQQRQAQKP